MPKHSVRNIKKMEVEVDGKLEELPDPAWGNGDMTIEVVHVPEPEFVSKKIRLLIDSNVRITGKYSGRNYLFNGAGSVQDVDETDVEWLLERRQGGRQCCGGAAEGNVVFELAEE